ncbi:sericin 1-like [Diaphorina citri]|uniref:Sericin 1-like n=1 Tax=Diaphorina citri TaxID=121845 RepID=A0A3Q0IN77_DIACI|nr:sericin 1-like [Diaphorina citri]
MNPCREHRPNDGHKTPSAHAVGAPTNGHKTGAASPSAHAVGTNGHKSGLSLSRTSDATPLLPPQSQRRPSVTISTPTSNTTPQANLLGLASDNKPLNASHSNSKPYEPLADLDNKSLSTAKPYETLTDLDNKPNTTAPNHTFQTTSFSNALNSKPASVPLAAKTPKLFPQLSTTGSSGDDKTPNGLTNPSVATSNGPPSRAHNTAFPSHTGGDGESSNTGQTCSAGSGASGGGSSAVRGESSKGGESMNARGGEGAPTTSSASQQHSELVRAETLVSTDSASNTSGRASASFRNSSRFAQVYASGPVSQRASRSSLQYQVSCEDNSGLDDSLVTALEDQDDILLLCEYSPLPYDSGHNMNYKGKNLH